MKQFLVLFLTLSSMLMVAIEEPLNETAHALPDTSQASIFKNNEKHDFESKQIDWKTHFDESVQIQKKFEKKQKESVSRSKLLSEHPKTARHSMEKTLMFYDSDHFESRPIHWGNLESDTKSFKKRERNKILSKQAQENVDRLANRYKLKKANSAEVLQEQQRKLDELNALLDQAVAEINLGD